MSVVNSRFCNCFSDTLISFCLLASCADLGMLEDGMTLDDKRSLWTVVKISQDTAKAEEQDRQKQARRALQFDQVTSVP